MCWRRWACPSTLGPELAVECLRETGFMFLFAPLYHPAMKAVGPLRRALGFRTIFNLCGPLTNPAGARTQVIGVLAPSRVLLVGRALVELGAKRAFVVHGTDGIDELTTTGESVVARVEETEAGGTPTMKAARITPEMAGLPRATLDQFTGGDVKTNAALLYDVLTGVPGARRDIVLLNAAAGLVAAGLAGDLKEGVRLGAEAIDSGRGGGDAGQAAAVWSEARASLAQQLDGERVRFAVEVFLQRVVEIGRVHGCLGGGAGEERHRRTKLHVVWDPENLIDWASLDKRNQPSAPAQPGTEKRMPQIGHCLFQRADAEVHRLRAAAQALHLREDKPDPMRSLLARAQLGQSLLIDCGLCAGKAFEIEWVFHGGTLGWIALAPAADVKRGQTPGRNCRKPAGAVASARFCRRFLCLNATASL